MSERKTIQDASAETLALEAMLGELGPGEQVSYAEIQQRTGVTMDGRNRNRLRVAAKRAGRVYATIRGFGIAMSSGENGAAIVKGGMVRLDNHVKRQERVTSAILLQHGREMPPDDRAQVTAMAAMFATVRNIADQQKRELRLMRSKTPQRLAAR